MGVSISKTSDFDLDNDEIVDLNNNITNRNNRIINLIERNYNESDDESSRLDRYFLLNTSKDTTSSVGDKSIKFHHVIGKNIILSGNKKGAQRAENSFCDAIVFSSRPIGVYERVYIKIIKLSTLWNGMIRFGFTSVNPDLLIKKSTNEKSSFTESLHNMNINIESSTSSDDSEEKYPFDLPRYVYPDLTNKKGYWAGAIDESLLKENDILYFYVNSNGEIHYGVNNKYKGKFLDGVNVYSKPQQAQSLWAIFDIYGNTISIELIDNLNEKSLVSQQQEQQVFLNQSFKQSNDYDYPINVRQSSSYLQEHHNFRTLLNNSSSINSTGSTSSSPNRSLSSSNNSSLISSTISSTSSTSASINSNNSITTIIPNRLIATTTQKLTQIGKNNNLNNQNSQVQPVMLRQKKQPNRTNTNQADNIDHMLISCRRLCVDNHLNETLRNSIIDTSDVNEPETSRLNEKIVNFYEQIPILVHDASRKPLMNITNKFLDKIHGKNVEISQPDGLIAYRESSLRSLKERHSSFRQTFINQRETINNKESTRNAYIFMEKPIEKGKSLCVQIVGIDQAMSESKSSLGIGCTTCDPVNLDPRIDLPDDADDLLDRSEYWVVIKNIFNNVSNTNNHQVMLADELCFRLDETNGNVKFFINGNLVNSCLFSVDQTQKLWFFFDLCGKTNAIRLITPCQSEFSAQSTLTNSINNSSRSTNDTHYREDEARRTRPNSALIEYYKIQLLANEPKKSVKIDNEKKQNPSTEECRICWDAPIECVFYSCGHMCLCWNCALQLKNTNFKPNRTQATATNLVGEAANYLSASSMSPSVTPSTSTIRSNTNEQEKNIKKPLCPICRNEIIDIIRFFKS